MRRQQYASNQATVGTEAHYRQSVQSIETARLSTAQYLAYFTEQGAKTATEIGKLAVKHAAQFGDLPTSLANLSPTSLHKRESRKELTDAQAKAVRWLWSIETRARQVLRVAQPETATQAQTTASSVTPGAPEPQATPATTKAKKLPNLDTLPVQRAAIAAVMQLLEQGMASESWQEIADARKMLSGLLA